MAVETWADALKLVREADGMEIDLGPLQGLWTEEQYLRLTDQTNLMIEFTDGVIEVLPMPTDDHQVVVAFIYEALLAFIRPRGGKVLFAPLRVRIRPGRHREPDILLVRDARDTRRQNRYWLGADLVVEVVSPDKPERDTKEKPVDYADAGILEYWIVDPMTETITVLALAGDAYAEYGSFGRGETATLLLLEGFTLSVDATFAVE